MRGFILIAIFAAASVSARPEPPRGYNYQPQQSSGGHASGGHSGYNQNAQPHVSGGGHAAGGHSYNNNAQAFSGGSGFNTGSGFSDGGFTSGGGHAAGGHSGGFSSGGGHSAGGQSGGFSAGPQQTIVQKHIYVHVPPPEDEVEVQRQQAIAAAPRKHYKIIFIKAPSAPSIAQQAAVAQAQNSEKTLIYVLVKKPEDINFEAPELPAPLAPSKPEVYFIKYKTQKDAGGAVASSGASSFASSGGFSGSTGGNFAGSSGSGFAGGSQSTGGSYASSSASAGGYAAGPAPANPHSSYGVPSHK